jgi:GT2 family glycosyltransferase
MCEVLPSAFHSLSADFARAISRKFERGRFLVIGADPPKLERQFAETGREALILGSSSDLATRLREGDGAARFEIAVWFYPLEYSDDDRLAEELSRVADDIVLIPGAGVNVSQRRPQLVECFRRFGLLPDYKWDPSELNPTAMRLRHEANESPDTLIPATERAFAMLNAHLSAMQRINEIHGSELEAAHRHIATLEEKLLKLKEYRRELKSLKEEIQILRKSLERRIGQALLAPYRLPEKLVKAIRKKLYPRVAKVTRSTAPTEYQEWFERHRASASNVERMRDEARAFAFQPLISVITPVFDTPVLRLKEAVESVLAQAYEKWELLLIDDGSSAGDLLHALPNLAARDRRIIPGKVGKHAGISAASNHGIALARGEWVTFLDHDDVLEPDALFHIVKVLQSHPEAGLIYSDEDKLGDDGFEAPLFKPDWSPDLFLSCNYVGHLTAVQREVLQKAGGFRSQFDSAQDYDLFFRVIEQTNRIHHVPCVLYHWRRSESSSAISVRQKPGQLEASRLAIEDHLKRRGEQAHVGVDWRTHAFCVRRELLEAQKISVIIRSCHRPESLQQCVETLTTQTSYPNYEIVVVQGHDKSRGGTVDFSRFPHRSLYLSDAVHDSSARNYAVEQTDSPWLLFLDDSIEVIEPDWLAIMAEHVQRTEVGAVGAQLLSPSGAVEHAGIVVGVNNIAQLAFRGLPSEQTGVNRQLHMTRNCSAVSSACMLVRREIFQETGGFDEKLSGTLADVDLCLKIRHSGYLIVYTPFAKLCWHDADLDKIDTAGQAIMNQRWAGVLQRDSYYNPNLSRERADFSLGK